MLEVGVAVSVGVAVALGVSVSVGVCVDFMVGVGVTPSAGARVTAFVIVAVALAAGAFVAPGVGVANQIPPTSSPTTMKRYAIARSNTRMSKMSTILFIQNIIQPLHIRPFPHQDDFPGR